MCAPLHYPSPIRAPFRSRLYRSPLCIRFVTLIDDETRELNLVSAQKTSKFISCGIVGSRLQLKQVHFLTALYLHSRRVDIDEGAHIRVVRLK